MAVLLVHVVIRFTGRFGLFALDWMCWDLDLVGVAGSWSCVGVLVVLLPLICVHVDTLSVNYDPPDTLSVIALVVSAQADCLMSVVWQRVRSQ